MRPSWDEYFMRIASLTSERSNCLRRQVGSLVVKDKRIMSLGYNGTPRGTVNCYEGGCERCAVTNQAGSNLDLCMCLHAEENALFFVSRHNLEGATLYTTLIPCIGCAKKIIQVGIKRVVYIHSYLHELDQISLKTFESSGVAIEQIQGM